VNTPSFLLAALRNEKLIHPIKGRQRRHELGDVDGFIEKVNKLMAYKSSPKKATTKKAALKKKRSTVKQK
jgi:hypothetical protein